MSENLALRDDSLSAIDDLLADARAVARNEATLGDEWVSSAAAILARAIMEQSTDDLAQLQKHLRVLAARSDRTASDTAPSAASPDVHRLRVLVEVADAGADLVRPRAAGLSCEPDSLAARVLIALLGGSERFSVQLVSELGVANTQVSRELHKLRRDGLVQRRQYGRTVSWLLTTSGTEMAGALQVRIGPPDEAVTVRSASEFDAAVGELANAISVPTALIEDGEPRAGSFLIYRRQKTAPAEGKPVFHNSPAPTVLVVDDENDAYVLTEPDWSAIQAAKLASSGR